MNTLILLFRWSVNIALAAVIGYSAVQLWLLFYSTPLQPIRPRSAVNHQPQLPTLNISALLEARLFGTPSDVGTQIALKKTLPETKLNLKLHGIYYSSEPQKSFAIIATANGKSASYHTLENLPNGAVLQKIEPRTVILLHNERHETLTLVGTKKTNSLQTQATKQLPTPTIAINNISAEKLLGNFQRQLQTNPNSLMKLMRIYPVNQGEHFIGYRLKPGKDATLFSRFNLQSGDILTTINGVKLDSPLKGLSVVPQLATASQINLEVLRNGQIVPLYFTVEK